MIQFIVPAIPVAQPRARATTVNGAARMYEATQSHPIHVFKASVRQAAASAYHGPPLSEPLGIEVLFVFPRTVAQMWKTRPMPRLWHTKLGDCDNLLKAVLDALNGTTFRDDRQVASATVRKVIAAGDEQPHVEVTIRELGTP